MPAVSQSLCTTLSVRAYACRRANHCPTSHSHPHFSRTRLVSNPVVVQCMQGAQAPPPQMARAPTMRISLKPPKASAAPLPPSPFSRSQQQSPRGGSHSGSAESVRSEEGADDEARQGGAAQQAAAAQQVGVDFGLPLLCVPLECVCVAGMGNWWKPSC